MQTNTPDTKPASAILETGEKIPFNQRSKHPVVNFVLLWAVFFGIFGVIWWLGEVGLRVKATVLINDLGLMFIAIATMLMAAGAAWLVLLKDRKEGLR